MRVSCVHVHFATLIRSERAASGNCTIQLITATFLAVANRGRQSAMNLRQKPYAGKCTIPCDHQMLN